jgi:hypothetical protein
MDVMFHVAHAQAARLLAGLARACTRRATVFACFFTHDGVKVLDDPEVREAIAGAARAAACRHAWERFCGARACPVELASQTASSALAAKAARVISL